MNESGARFNLKDSKAYEVLSQPKVVPFDTGAKCGILNNHNHPKVNIAGADELHQVDAALDYHVKELRKLRDAMEGLGFETREFNLALNFLFGHQHIIWETLNRNYNQRAADYAESRKAGVHHG